MAIGSIANAAAAFSMAWRTATFPKPHHKLMLFLLTDKTCAGGAIIELSTLAQVCGADSGVSVYQDLEALAQRGYLTISEHRDGKCFVAFGIATREEVATAYEWLDCEFPLVRGPAVDDENAMAFYDVDRWGVE
jgi:hypothetical protein